jgi:hypothetical protein
MIVARWIVGMIGSTEQLRERLLTSDPLSEHILAPKDCFFRVDRLE